MQPASSGLMDWMRVGLIGLGLLALEVALDGPRQRREVSGLWLLQGALISLALCMELPSLDRLVPAACIAVVGVAALITDRVTNAARSSASSSPRRR
jgi:hypothetical protein